LTHKSCVGEYPLHLTRYCFFFHWPKVHCFRIDLTSHLGVSVIILPTFFHFLAHMTTCAFSSYATYLHALSCAFKSQDLSLPILHSHALSSLLMCLSGSIGCAEAFYHVSITHLSLTHLPPFGTIHLPLYGMLPDPCHASDILYLRSCFTYIRLPYDSHISSPSHFLDSVLYLASFTVSHLYPELDSDPYIYINP
jgi:hypothetical protein